MNADIQHKEAESISNGESEYLYDSFVAHCNNENLTDRKLVCEYRPESTLNNKLINENQTQVDVEQNYLSCEIEQGSQFQNDLSPELSLMHYSSEYESPTQSLKDKDEICHQQSFPLSDKKCAPWNDNKLSQTIRFRNQHPLNRYKKQFYPPEQHHYTSERYSLSGKAAGCVPPYQQIMLSQEEDVQWSFSQQKQTHGSEGIFGQDNNQSRVLQSTLLHSDQSTSNSKTPQHKTHLLKTYIKSSYPPEKNQYTTDQYRFSGNAVPSVRPSQELIQSQEADVYMSFPNQHTHPVLQSTSQHSDKCALSQSQEMSCFNSEMSQHNFMDVTSYDYPSVSLGQSTTNQNITMERRGYENEFQLLQSSPPYLNSKKSCNDENSQILFHETTPENLNKMSSFYSSDLSSRQLNNGRRETFIIDKNRYNKHSYRSSSSSHCSSNETTLFPLSPNCSTYGKSFNQKKTTVVMSQKALVNERKNNDSPQCKQKKDEIISLFSVTPMGAYCIVCRDRSVCDGSVSTTKFALIQHVRRRHDELYPSHSTNFNYLSQKLKRDIEKAKSQRDKSEFLAHPKKEKLRYHCSKCNQCFEKINKCKQHITKSKGKCTSSHLKWTKCLLLKCSHYYPTDLINTIKEVKDLTFSQLPTAACVSRDKTMDILKPFVKADADLEFFTTKFHPLVNSIPNRFDDFIIKCIEQSTKKPEKDEICLQNLLKSINCYFDNIQSIVGFIPGNLRAKLQKFTHSDENISNEWSFSDNRCTNEPRLMISKLLSFLYRNNSKYVSQYKTNFNSQYYSKDEVHK